MKNTLIILLSLLLCFLFQSCNKSAVTGTLPGWSALGNIQANGAIRVMSIDKTNNLYVAGRFKDPSGNLYVAKWDGNAWSQLGTSFTPYYPDGAITSLVTDPLGNVYITGDFKDSIGKYYVAKWNGTTWSDIGECEEEGSLAVDASGNLYTQILGVSSITKIIKWNGYSWVELAGIKSLNDYSGIGIDNSGNVYASGILLPDYLSGFCRWNGSDWTLLVNANNTSQVSLFFLRNIISDVSGNLYASGFNLINSKQYVFKWNSLAWSEVDNASNDPLNANNIIGALALDASNNIYAAGQFTNAQGYNYVAKWDGKNWSDLKHNSSGAKFNGAINCLAVDASGNIYAAGAFTDNHGFAYVAKFTK
jgi:hypothetical protein